MIKEKLNYRLNILLKIKVLVLVCLASIIAFAADNKNEAATNGKKNNAKSEQTTETAQKQSMEKRKQITEEAVAALRETQNALKALDDNKTTDALAALERASGKLTIILARDPKNALAPVNTNAVTYDILADINAITALRRDITKAMDVGRLQEARHLIKNLASETVVSVTNIPLATYPDAIKAAVKCIDNQKMEDAKKILQTALNTLVVKDIIIPLPIVIAENLLKEAQILAEKGNRSEDENKRLSALLEKTRTELDYAEALGYGTKDDFKHLFDELEQITQKTKSGKSGFGFFDKIKEFLRDIKKSDQKEEPKK